MNGMVVLDTSVVVKWFRQEEKGARYALAYRNAYLEGQISIVLPDLALYELANVLCHKRDLTVEQIVQALDSLLEMELLWADPSAELLARAVRVARQCQVTLYDAVFVALAQWMGAPLVTADEYLVRQTTCEVMVQQLGQEVAGPPTSP